MEPVVSSYELEHPWEVDGQELVNEMKGKLSWLKDNFDLINTLDLPDNFKKNVINLYEEFNDQYDLESQFDFDDAAFKCSTIILRDVLDTVRQQSEMRIV
tara:strand:- start:310 stop:609 length:300 start_codon:yes stop_codon:yes gene_type:complete